MSERPTPRTDALAWEHRSHINLPQPYHEAMRELSRTESQLAERDAQIEVARMALEEIASREWLENALNPQDAASIAEKALARIDAKGGERE